MLDLLLLRLLDGDRGIGSRLLLCKVICVIMGYLGIQDIQDIHVWILYFYSLPAILQEIKASFVRSRQFTW